MTRRVLSLIIPLLLLAVAGCRFCAVEKSADGRVRLIAGSFLTDPEIGSLRWATTSPTTQTVVILDGYKSKSDATAADVVSAATEIAKTVIGAP